MAREAKRTQIEVGLSRALFFLLQIDQMHQDLEALQTNTLDWWPLVAGNLR
jgi:hypothetical protein